MKILVVGGGGREHALIWKIAQSPLVDRIYCAPGNAGIQKLADCVPIDATDIEELVRFASGSQIDLTVVGPEDPLSRGITDAFKQKGLRVFGVNQKAAKLESSKAFSKQIMQRHSIPTATFRVFQSAEAAKAHIERVGAPIVVKADGLAKGKGVIVCQAVDEALKAVDHIMRDKVFGEAGEQVVVEQCLMGEEASVLAFTDGKTIAIMPSSQDHKRLEDGDNGPNTGGMGAYSPAPVVTPRIMEKIEREILVQTVHAMNVEERPYCGVLYAGVMIAENDPKVLEYNVRFGDPETQPLMVRLKSDIVPILMAVTDGTLEDQDIEWDRRHTVCVVMASAGYPETATKGTVIEGVDEADAMPDVVVFHSGTAMKNGKLVTAGGRVLGVTAVGNTIVEAQARVYEAIEKIHFDGMQFRTDIGQRAIDRLAEGKSQ